MLQQTPPKKNNIASVIITFNPDEHFPSHVRALSPQVEQITIVDNASTDENFTFISEAQKQNSNVLIMKNSQNQGIAQALNKGMRYALENGFSWILLMDHDSHAADYMVKALIEAYQEAKRQNLILDLIGVNFTHQKTGTVAFAKECNDCIFIKKTGIQTSGSLLSQNAYTKVGPFREDFFIDYVDTEYCLRLKHKGFHSAISCRAHMSHTIGVPNEIKFMGKSVSVKNYNQLRRYYRTRNGFTLMREYVFKEPLWVFTKILFLAQEWLILFTAEKNKREKLKSILHGVKDYISKNMGKHTL
ncbi:MAG: hypothetical protein A2249_00180 [Candidatus Jacksonbacteria bacterium RIFOXYA2_FULL_44_7]|uniref:Glycosyltransferase 2-like domain-containing protein n=1 Tax=Candidatus Jacksonbacteria bacterium RIFCSPLOWO2_02_FULL_44_20 TaxID=1798460 RepID=A0A1G2A7X8_9BACT|nr:MAG: Glycosyl transferase family protein [Parcubacteria group bacterium GW2011_GWC2_44_17]KKT50076.1 MAG: Glycosyl transferase family protein [Parcubacteria group bacterium GW2011_GWF2_44_17]OGY69501.1 MAG: hypothetical protein A3C00_00365 [Candidatus Jacksonbacteria bacterium RIFCSPHIGHO2_02_FULL_44_25]OGY71534.1 MAG: hypothetical protein A3E05_04240 [Candidatus Jacksonbacteria bacterium RIFCSPHIGHO2_12_FULL_44_12]OGY72785.1 MAG: hypothetical protein A3H61_02425 [Candidatus Jacksonbacteria 